jgi:5,10-methenyltetrahydrofolate synthetase
MPPTRSALRHALLSAREAWAASPDAIPAQADLHAHLARVLAQLEPACLGLYWPVRGEFNPMPAALEAKAALNCILALPWATKAVQGSAASMTFRRWDGSEPATRDECGIPSPDTPPAPPDVVLVPCVGFTQGGVRLGYGGGYFDRWLAAHPHVTAIGVAWDEALLDDEAFEPQPHDVPMTLIVTPGGVVDAG